MSLNDLISQFSRYVHRINDTDVSQMPGLAEGTNTHTLKTTVAIYYSLYNKPALVYAVTDNIAMTVCSAQAVSTFCYYLVSVSAVGGVTVTKGTDNAYALPSTPPGTAAMGAILITTDSSHSFTSGTTDISSAGITSQFFDIDCGVATMLINAAQTRLERGVTIVRNGREHLVSDFDHMIVRAQIAIAATAASVTLPFPGYKNFQEDGIKIIDSSGVIFPIDKEDIVPTGVSFQSRPAVISRNPPIEVVFTPDGFPAREFDIFPVADQAYTIDATAYQYSPYLDGVIYPKNWLTENAPDVLLFGALVEAGSYFPSDERIGEWKARWNDAVWTLFAAQSKEKYSGSYIKTKYPNPLHKQGQGLGLSSNKAGIYSFGMID